jgi:hypothetical protein
VTSWAIPHFFYDIGHGEDFISLRESAGLRVERSASGILLRNRNAVNYVLLCSERFVSPIGEPIRIQGGFAPDHLRRIQG